MSHPTTPEERVHQTVTLYRQGLTRRAIARALGLSRNTVRRVLQEQLRRRDAPHQALQPKPPPAARPSKLDRYRDRVVELLRRYPDITAQRVFEELRAVGFPGGYTAVKKYMRKVRPPKRPEPSLVTPEYGPGEMAESDWSPHKIPFTVAGLLRVQVLVYFLCFSRRRDFRVYESCDLHALTDGHVQTFERFGGAARACKYDGQKPVILGWEGRQPIFNPRFLAFATHYEFRPEACRPRHPNDKPGAERSFWEFERSFLCGRTFRDLDDMRRQLAHWQDTVCDTRVHKKLRRTPLEAFADERDHLVSLPRHPYDTARVVYRVCSIDGFVAWDGNRYAVPYQHVTDLLPVRITQRELFVYAADLRCVARHELAPRSAGVDVDPHGLHPPWKRCAADLDQLRQAFADLGEHGEAFFAALSTATPRFAGYHARQILLLRERYATGDLTAALHHARTFGAFDHNAVARILAARAAPRTLAEYVAEDTARRIEQRLGPDRTRPRDLDEYDRLPLATASQPLEDPCPNARHQTPTATSSSSDCDDTSDF
jgi:transposase